MIKLLPRSKPPSSGDVLALTEEQKEKLRTFINDKSCVDYNENYGAVIIAPFEIDDFIDDIIKVIEGSR